MNRRRFLGLCAVAPVAAPMVAAGMAEAPPVSAYRPISHEVAAMIGQLRFESCATDGDASTCAKMEAMLRSRDREARHRERNDWRLNR